MAAGFGLVLAESDMCRLCGWEDEANLQICDEEVCIVFNSLNLLTAKVSELIEQNLNLNLRTDIDLPNKICQDCKTALQMTAEFLAKVRQGQIFIQKLILTRGDKVDLVKDIRMECNVNLPPPSKGKRGRPKKGFEKKRIDADGKDAASRVVCADKRKRKPPKHLEQFEISSLENPAASKGWKDLDFEEVRLNIDEDPMDQYKPASPTTPVAVETKRSLGNLIKVYKCEFCESFMKSEDELRVHKEREHGEFMFRCALIDCELLLRNKAELDKHQEETGHEGMITLSISQPTLPTAVQESPSANNNEKHNLEASSSEISKPLFFEYQEPKEQLSNSQDLAETLLAQVEFPKADENELEIKPKDPENNPQASEYTPLKTEDKPEVKPLHSSSFVSTFRPAETKPPDEIKPLLTRSKDKSSVIKSGIYSCKNCLKAFDSGFSLQVHTCSGFQCNACALTFHTEATYTAHLRVEHEVASTRTYACDECEREFSAPSSLQYHRDSVHKMVEYKCTAKDCDKTFKVRNLLTRHLKTHSADRPFKCNVCDKGFKRLSNLTAHVLSHEKTEKSFCDVCGQSFKYVNSLKLHMKLHLGEKKFTCPFCGKDFIQKGNMKEHMRIHTGEKPFQCDKCEKSFATSSQLRNHVKGHDGVKPYSCEQCAKRFMHLETLKLHIKRHTGEKIHVCDLCDKSFVDLSSLKKHYDTHNPVKGRVTCRTCGKSYSDKSSLRKHMKTHQPGDETKNTVWNIIRDVGEDQLDGDDDIQQVIYISYDEGAEGSLEEGIRGTDINMVDIEDKDGQQIRLVAPMNIDPLTFAADYLKDLQSIPVTE